MKQIIDVLIPILFIAPACATYLGGPYIGIGLSGIYLFFHYAHGTFRAFRLLGERNKNDPMQIVEMSPSSDCIDWDPMDTE